MPLAKAFIVNTEKTEFEPIKVMFNPPSLKIKSATRYADSKTLGVTQEKLQFIKKDNDVLTVELFFDTTHNGTNVSSLVDPILELTKVAKGAESPPKLVFAWGEFNFPCIIVAIDQNYDYFDSMGRALRATLVVTFLRCEPEEEAPAKDDSSAKEEGTAATVKSGQNLSDLVNENTGDPKNWRPTAKENNISNPLEFNQGSMVGKTVKIVK